MMGLSPLELALRLFCSFLGIDPGVFGATGPGEIGDALRLLGFPYALAFMITSGMRYVPLIGLKVRHITEAQRSRGIDLAFRLRNVKNLIALLMPLLFQSFILADDLAVAMESRGVRQKGAEFPQKLPLFPDGLDGHHPVPGSPGGFSVFGKRLGGLGKSRVERPLYGEKPSGRMIKRPLSFFQAGWRGSPKSGLRTRPLKTTPPVQAFGCAFNFPSRPIFVLAEDHTPPGGFIHRGVVVSG